MRVTLLMLAPPDVFSYMQVLFASVTTEILDQHCAKMKVLALKYIPCFANQPCFHAEV